MKRYAPIAMAALAATGMWALLAQPAAAQPTLHVVCVLPTLPCTDNGSNTPTSDPFPHFTFSASPGPSTGTDFMVDVLVPTSDTGIPASFTLTGTQGGTTNTSPIAATATSVAGTWSTGKLDAFLGISASPANPIGAYIGGPFQVFQADLGATQLRAEGDRHQRTRASHACAARCWTCCARSGATQAPHLTLCAMMTRGTPAERRAFFIWRSFVSTRVPEDEKSGGVEGARDGSAARHRVAHTTCRPRTYRVRAA